MHSVNIYFSVFHTYKGFLYAAFAHAQRLYLRPGKGNACFIGILDKIVVKRFFVVGNQLDS